MNINDICFEKRQTVCPKCHEPASMLQIDDLRKKCLCGFVYGNGDLKIKVIKYKRPEIESEVIL